MGRVTINNQNSSRLVAELLGEWGREINSCPRLNRRLALAVRTARGTSETARLQLAVSIFGRATQVEIEYTQVAQV